MRLIDAEALKKAILEHRNDYIEDNFFWTKLFDEIDNAPTVPLPDFKEGYKQAIIEELTKEITHERDILISDLKAVSARRDQLQNDIARFNHLLELINNDIKGNNNG